MVGHRLNEGIGHPVAGVLAGHEDAGYRGMGLALAIQGDQPEFAEKIELLIAGTAGEEAFVKGWR